MKTTTREKIHGALYAYAIGDALGVGTEFMTIPERKMRYPEGLRHYEQIFRDLCRRVFKPGQWTNDTEVVLLLADSISERAGVDYLDFARKLKKWNEQNAEENLASMRWVINQPSFIDYPLETSRDVWAKMTNMEATNEALGRAMLTGLWNENTDEHVADISEMTHAHIRCTAAARVIGRMSNSLMWHDRPAEPEELIALANDSDKNKEVAAYVEMAYAGDIEGMRADDPMTFNYVRKTMGVALWALWHCKDTGEGILKVCDLAGDADTNASLAGALLALRYGLDGLPQDLIDNLLEKPRLEKTADRFASVLEEKFGK